MRHASLLLIMFLLPISLALTCETGELNLTLSPQVSQEGAGFIINYAISINQSSEYMLNTTNLSLYWVFLDIDQGYFSLSNKTWFHKEENVPNNGSIQGQFNIAPWTYMLYGFLSCNTSLCNNTYCCPCNFDQALILYPEKEYVTAIDRVYERLEPSMIVEIVDYPKVVHKGEEFQIRVNVTNVKIEEEAYIYSYVYQGLNVLSEDWLHNRQKLEIPSGYSELITLTDKVVNLDEPDTYNLKVRVKVDEDNYDSVVPVTVLLSNEVEATQDIKQEGTVKPAQYNTPKSSVTGSAVVETNPKSLYLILALFSFVLLVVLIKVIK